MGVRAGVILAMGANPFVGGLRTLKVTLHRQKEALNGRHQIPWLTWSMLRVVAHLATGIRGLRYGPICVGDGLQPQEGTLFLKEESATELYTSCRSRRHGTAHLHLDLHQDRVLMRRTQ